MIIYGMFYYDFYNEIFVKTYKNWILLYKLKFN